MNIHRLKYFLIVFLILIASAAQPKALWRGATSLTGGGDGAVDAIDGVTLYDGDILIAVTSSGTYFYILDDDSAAVESSPDVISPDTNAGDKRWVLESVYYQTIDVLSFTGTTLSISLESDGEANKTVDLAGLQDGVDVPTELSVGTVGVETVAITSDGGTDDVTLPAATNAAAGMATATQITALETVDTSAEVIAIVEGGATAFEAADAAIVKSDEAETLSANWVNTAHPWALNEGGTGQSTVAGWPIGDTAFSDLTNGSSYGNYGAVGDDTLDELFSAINTAIGDLADGVNVPTELSVGTVGVETVAITSDGGADDVTLPAATNAAAGMATATQITALETVDTSAEVIAIVEGGATAFEAADAAIVKSDEAETLSANWVNTAHPWALNEGGTGQSTVAGWPIGDTAFSDLTNGSSYGNYGAVGDDTLDELFSAINTAIGGLAGGHDAVTLGTASHDYLSLTDQVITLGEVDIGDDTNLAGTANEIVLTGDTLSLHADVKGLPRSYLAGLQLSNGADADQDIDIAVGECRDSANSCDLILASGLTKQLDAIFAAGTDAGGLFSGSAANSTGYHVFIIKKDSDDTIDVGFDTSSVAKNIPEGYTEYRRLGWIYTDGAGADIYGFTQIGDTFLWDNPFESVDEGSVDQQAAALKTMDVPVGLKVKALINVRITDGGNPITYLSCPDANDEAPSTSAAPLASIGGESNVVSYMEVYTNTSAQIRVRGDTASVNEFDITTLGWTDRRGRDD